MKGLNKEILRLAIPSILANITVPLVGMVDIAVAGHLSATEITQAATFIGGISLGSMLFDLIYWNFGFLRSGTGGLTAQSYGRNDVEDMTRTLIRGVLLALVFSLAIIALQWPFTQLAFLFVDSTSEVRELALNYFFIRIWAAPATLSLMTFRGWFIGMQDTVSSMFTDLMVNITNIVASISLARVIGFEGIAYGTLIAQYAGLLLACGIVAIKYNKMFRSISLRTIFASIKGNDFKKFLSLNTDIFWRSIFMTAIYIGFTSLSAKFGDLMLASGTILMKLLMVFSFFTDGFAYAGEALTGKYIGRQNKEMTRKSVKMVFAWSLTLAVAFLFVYWGVGRPMISLLTTDIEVIDATCNYIPWLMLMPPLGCAAFAWDGIFIGATSSKPIRNAMFWSFVAFIVVWIVGKGIIDSLNLNSIAYNSTALHVLMGAYFAHLAVRTVYLSFLYKKSILIEPFQPAHNQVVSAQD